MHDFKRRTERVLLLFASLTVFCSWLMPARAAEEPADMAEEEAVMAAEEEAAEEEPEEVSEEETARAAVETLLRNYQTKALLYEDSDLRAGTVVDPGLVLPEGAEEQLFRVAKKDVTLPRLKDNFVYLEKKAAFYAAMRQLQGIWRDNLRLVYDFGDLALSAQGDVGTFSVKETAQFRYTDSERLSVNETFYTVWLVRAADQWLIADVTDGSRFDTIYKSQGAGFDEGAALEEFAANLERDGCTLTFPYTSSDGEGKLLYNGANAAAYAYTYARPDAGAARSTFYNDQFYSYAGQGGDCQNFASQCMWAGFDGSQTGAAIRGHSLPMDASGDSQWFGRAASGGTINYGWISCQSFRKYLTGSADAVGSGGSNAGGEAGMYATILDVAAASGFSGVTVEELVGATAHVEGSGGDYAHAIVITAATGTRRSEIWFCGHTKDVAHVKLGDYYIWPMKVYIPRYLRTGASAANRVATDRIPPVDVGGTGLLTARTGETQYQITITVTPPGGEAQRAASVYWADSCQTEYTFTEPGLYQVVSAAKAAEGADWAITTYYVRCREAPVFEETGEEEVMEETEFDEDEYYFLIEGSEEISFYEEEAAAEM